MTLFSIRPAEKRDAPELARLFTELGHSMNSGSISERWSDWADAGNTALLAQRSDGAILGVATLHQMIVLHRRNLSAESLHFLLMRPCGVAGLAVHLSPRRKLPWPIMVVDFSKSPAIFA